MLKTFTKREKKLLKGLKTKYFHFVMMKSTSTERELKQKKKKKKVEERKKKKEQEKQDEKTTGLNKFNKWIIDEEIDLNKELFKKYFNFQRPSDMLMLLNKTNDETKNNELVNMINSGLKDLKEEIEKMTKKEKEVEDPELIVEIVEKILKINEENQ